MLKNLTGKLVKIILRMENVVETEGTRLLLFCYDLEDFVLVNLSD